MPSTVIFLVFFFCTKKLLSILFSNIPQQQHRQLSIIIWCVENKKMRLQFNAFLQAEKSHSFITARKYALKYLTLVEVYALSHNSVESYPFTEEAQNFKEFAHSGMYFCHTPILVIWLVLVSFLENYACYFPIKNATSYWKHTCCSLTESTRHVVLNWEK